jgi:hypothetical protein
MLNVKLVRLSTGEDVITNVVEDTDVSVKFKNPIVAFPSEMGKIGFAPWSPLIDKDAQEMEVSKKFIIYIADPDQGIVEQYNQMFGTKLVTPNKKLIV